LPDQEKPNDRCGTAPEDTYKKDVINSIKSVVQELQRQNDEANPRNIRERRLRMAEVIGLWLAAGIGLVAVIVASLDARGQRGVMQGQLNEMQAEQRPWLRVDATPGDFVVLDPPGTVAYPTIVFNPHFIITNVGKSSAFNALLSFTGWSDVVSRDDPHRAQAKICELLARQPTAERHDGRIMFPGDHFNEELGSAKQNVGFMGPDFAKGLIKKNQEWPMHLKVIGCVDFLFGSPPEHHQTGFIYDVYRVEGIEARAGPFHGSEFLNPTFDASKSVPAADVTMWPGPNSALAN
jgi:hypothetical protein